MYFNYWRKSNLVIIYMDLLFLYFFKAKIETFLIEVKRAGLNDIVTADDIIFETNSMITSVSPSYSKSD